jgi:ribosome biogenesis protein Nip4
LRKDHRLWVTENSELKIIFGHKRDEVPREVKKLHEELRNLCSSSNPVRKDKSGA